VVDDGENGFLVPPGDVDVLAEKIQVLLGDREMRAAFGVHGRKKAETRYSWREIGRDLEKVYQEVLG